ncbi:MAG: PIG-L family deacetylase [Rhodospirillales bacterium]|nr:PIG-L family deacetylase [Rhodospirillales bacterium]
MDPANPYRSFVAGIAAGLAAGAAITTPWPMRPCGAAAAMTAGIGLLFSPHPDDECLTGGLALRLRREAGMRIINVAATLGSERSARSRRRGELARACAVLAFATIIPGEDGFEDINPVARAQGSRQWSAAVDAVARILVDHQPEIIVVPHGADGHATHIGTHHLVFDALAILPAAFRCRVIETEYWSPMTQPNLMVESSIDDVADLIAALAQHAGEVARSPYHLTLPAWMIDNVRRGAETIGGWRARARPFVFATLYRASMWSDGRLQPCQTTKRMIAADADITQVLRA